MYNSPAFLNPSKYLQELSAKLIDDKDFLEESFIYIDKMRQWYGNGCLIIDIVGFFPYICGDLTYKSFPDIKSFWLNADRINQHFPPQILTQLLDSAMEVDCPTNRIIFVFCAIVQEGDMVHPFYQRASVIDILKLPSLITSKQIKKRLQRMLRAGVYKITLDTSNPDFIGSNLEKWLREIKHLEKQTGQKFSVSIDEGC